MHAVRSTCYTGLAKLERRGRGAHPPPAEAPVPRSPRGGRLGVGREAGRLSASLPNLACVVSVKRLRSLTLPNLSLPVSELRGALERKEKGTCGARVEWRERCTDATTV